MAEPLSLEYVLTVLDDDGRSDAVHQPYTAFNQGFDAALEHGLSKELNPYDDDRACQRHRDQTPRRK